MQLAFCGSTALYLTRAMRLGLAGPHDMTAREPLRSPSPGSKRRRFTKKLLVSLRIDGILPLPLSRPLEVAVPRPSERLQGRCFVSTVYGGSLPQKSFTPLGDGLQVSCPELLFVEMASVMPFFNLVLLGCELCGTYARDPRDPIGGSAAFGVAPASSVQELLAYARQCRSLPGAAKALDALRYVMDNAWSPMEAIVAALAALPPEHFGYGLGPVVLNDRVDTPDGASRASRLPDMTLGGTTTGLNYDGENHLDLSTVVDTAVQMTLNPGNGQSSERLDKSVNSVRAKYVDDRRRDRELMASGYHIFVLTYEDLVERGGLDRVMLLAMDSMEHAGEVDLSMQRGALASAFLRRKRQELVWSALPGELGRTTRRDLVAARRQAREARYVYECDVRLASSVEPGR